MSLKVLTKKQNAVELVEAVIQAQLKNPELAPSRVLVVDIKSEHLDRIFTPARKELLEAIKEKGPKNIGEIARLLNRRIEAVSRDLKILGNYGLIEMSQVGKTKTPHIEKDMLLIPL